MTARHNDIALAVRNALAGTVVSTTGPVSSLAATTTGYKRTSGSFFDDGFRVGMEITPVGFTANPVDLIDSMTATTITTANGRTAQTAPGTASLDVRLPAARSWDYVTFDPPAGRPWLEEDYLQQPSLLPGLYVGGPLQLFSIYVLRLFGVSDVGSDPLFLMSDKILEVMHAGLGLSLPNGELARVRGDPAPWVSTTPRTDPQTKRPFCEITIPIRCDTINPS